MPVPDISHGPSMLAGAVKRVAAAMPDIDQRLWNEFETWTWDYLNSECRHWIFDSEENFDFYEWIEDCPYTRKRKDMLIKVWESIDWTKPLEKKNIVVKMHTKHEPYPEPKHFRGIYARADPYKTMVGPYHKKFGNKLFKDKNFIKKIPHPERPEFIKNLLDRYKYKFGTDFSQFEATFVQQILRLQNDIYLWTLQKCPKWRAFFEELFRVTEGENIIECIYFVFKLLAKRMSGEMDTSSGNGLMNMLYTSFILEKAGNKRGEYASVFEGDDSANGCDILPDVDLYRRLGANIKFVVFEDSGLTSFCGNVFHYDICHNICDPREVLANFGWVKTKYVQMTEKSRLKLIRAKSLSLVYQYPGCPIVKALGLYGLRVTSGISKEEMIKWVEINNRSESWWDADKQLLAVLKVDQQIIDIEVHPLTRQVMEKSFGVCVSQQLLIEQYLNSLNEIQPLEINMDFHASWYETFERYVVTGVKGFVPPEPTMCGYSTSYYINPATQKVAHH